MTEYTMRLRTARPPDELFLLLSQFDRFPQWSNRIRSVKLDGDTSHWELAFRTGLAHWTQRDTVHEAEHRIDFEQISGNFVTLAGTLTVHPHDSGSEVTYRISFRTSVPHLAGAIDPVIARTLSHAMLDVISAIADKPEILAGGELLQDLRVG